MLNNQIHTPNASLFPRVFVSIDPATFSFQWIWKCFINNRTLELTICILPKIFTSQWQRYFFWVIPNTNQRGDVHESEPFRLVWGDCGDVCSWSSGLTQGLVGPRSSPNSSLWTWGSCPDRSWGGGFNQRLKDCILRAVLYSHKG